MPPTLISFPQAFAINKGVNHVKLITFTGTPINTLLGGSFQFTQLNAQVPNLVNSQNVDYDLTGSVDSLNSSLIYKTGGNLVDTSMKYTNGKSLGNWYQIQKHASQPTGGSVTSSGGVLRITCGNNNTLLNRSIIHDVKYNRSGTPVTESSNSVTGYLSFTDISVDPATITVYFRGYVEYFNPSQSSGVTWNGNNTTVGEHVVFWVGHKYLHSYDIYGLDGANPIPLATSMGSSKGFGFQGIKNGDAFQWYAVVYDTDGVIVFAQNTNLSCFGEQKLWVTYNSGTITWYANDVQVTTTTINNLVNINNYSFSGGNDTYAGIACLKGGQSPLSIPGQFTICVKEAKVIRNLAHMESYNNYEDTDTSVTEIDTEYHRTGLQLMKKLK